MSFEGLNRIFNAKKRCCYGDLIIPVAAPLFVLFKGANGSLGERPQHCGAQHYDDACNAGVDSSAGFTKMTINKRVQPKRPMPCGVPGPAPIKEAAQQKQRAEGQQSKRPMRLEKWHNVLH